MKLWGFGSAASLFCTIMIHSKSNSYRILYVDDNPGDRRLFKESLADRANVDLRLASTGEELLEALEKEELPSLILMDWNLPGLTGVDLLRKIKSNEFTRAIPVIVFTTSLSPEKVVEIYNERANCIVEKPIGFDAFTDLALKIEEFWLQTSILPLHLGREVSARV